MILAALSALSLYAAAENARPFYRMPSEEVPRVLSEIHERTPNLSERLEAVSSGFLGVPYKLHPLGEGPDGEFDRGPLMDLSAVDCTTMIEEAMALSLEPGLGKAERVLQRIRYKDGRISYLTRNHFPEADWIPNNISAGFLKDVTREIGGGDVKTVSKKISKAAWYKAKSGSEIKGAPHLSAVERDRRLQKLRALGQALTDEEATLLYIPLADLPSVLNRIPGGTIANLVRSDRPDKPMLISHQILIVDHDGKKLVRHAASGRFVEDVPALEYFARYKNSRWPLLGINLNALTQPTS